MKIYLKNKKAEHDYEILERMTAGMELKGHEVKSIRGKRGSLAGARAVVRGGEVFVVGFDIPPYQPKNAPPDYEEGRTVRLLLNRSEIGRLEGKLGQKGLTLVPIVVYDKGGKLKMELALAKGKRKHEKREKLKLKEAKRRMERAMKGDFR